MPLNSSSFGVEFRSDSASYTQLLVLTLFAKLHIALHIGYMKAKGWEHCLIKAGISAVSAKIHSVTDEGELIDAESIYIERTGNHTNGRSPVHP